MAQRGMAMAGEALAAGGSSETFSFTLTKVALVEGMQHWLHSELDQPWFEYASGFFEPHKADVWRLAQDWAGRGLVDLVTARPLENRNWKSWRMIRRAACQPAAPMRSDDLGRMQLVALHRELCEAAREGLACPSYRALARAVTGQEGDAAQRRVRTLLQRLEGEGKIAITPAPRGARHGPKVTILTGKHQGKATAWPDSSNS